MPSFFVRASYVLLEEPLVGFKFLDEVVLWIGFGGENLPGHEPVKAKAVLDQATDPVGAVQEGLDAANVEVGHVGGGSDVLEVFGRQELGVGHLGREALIEAEEFES